jgi:hypothetical protein
VGIPYRHQHRSTERLLAAAAKHRLGLAALGVKVDDAKAANLVGTKAPKAK